MPKTVPGECFEFYLVFVAHHECSGQLYHVRGCSHDASMLFRFEMEEIEKAVVQVLSILSLIAHINSRIAYIVVVEHGFRLVQGRTHLF